MGPVADSGKANIQSGFYYRTKVLPLTWPVACENVRVSLNTCITFARLIYAPDTIVLLKFFVRCFCICKREKVVKFWYIFPLRSNFIAFVSQSSESTSFVCL